MKTHAQLRIFFLLLILFQLIILKRGIAQWQWADAPTIGGIIQSSDLIATDNTGNVIVAGKFHMATPAIAGNYTLNSYGYEDIYIIKYNASGNVIWATSIGGQWNDAATAISTDKFGNFFITGKFSSPSISFGNITLTNSNASQFSSNGPSKPFIAKYNSNGNIVWATIIPNHGFNPRSLSNDGYGNTYVAGHFSANFQIGTNTFQNHEDVYLAKFDLNGNFLWSKTMGSNTVPGMEICNSISSDNSGNVYLTGLFSSDSIIFAGQTINRIGIGGVDFFLAKYDSNGNELWAKNTVSTPDCYCNRAVAGNSVSVIKNSNIEEDGGVYVTGYFNACNIILGNDTLFNSTPNTTFYFDLFIAKYDQNGNVQWAKSAGTDKDDIGYAVSADNSNNVYLTGGFNIPNYSGSGNNTTPTYAPILFPPFTLFEQSTTPFFIVKYDNNGNVLCANSLFTGGGQSSSVTTDNQGNAFVAGANSTNNSFLVGSNTLNYTTLRNLFVAKYNCSNQTGVGEESIGEEMFSVYPNPSNGLVNINFNKEGLLHYEITDAIGKVILKDWVINDKVEIDLSQYDNGIYFIKAYDKTENTFAVKKLIKK